MAAKSASSQAQPGRAAELRPVALAGGVQAQRDVAQQTVLGRPLEQLERAVGLVAPAEALVVLDAGTGGGDVALVGAVHDLVHVREHDVRRVAAVPHEDLDLLEGARCRPRSG